MSVHVPPAVTHSSSNQPLFTQSPLISAMRPTQPAREQHQFPAIAAIQGEREPNASSSTRKRPRRSSRGATDNDSESLHVTRVKPEDTEEYVDTGHDARPSHSRSPVLSTNVSSQPQHPPNVKKRRTLLSQIDTEASKTAVDRVSSHNSPISPVVHGLPHGDEPKLHHKTSVHFSHGSGNGTSSNSTGAAPGPSRRTGGHLSSPPVPSAMAAPSLPGLPASPSSFASRRGISTNGPRKKPADLLLGRGTTSMSAPDLRLAVQSAPALPRGNIQPGCFPPIEMPSLPTLPPTLGIPPTVRRVAGQVPPTPNRPQALRSSSSNHSLHATGALGVGHSPPGVAIASSIIPPTPTALRAPGYTAERASFLAPFEGFYDALSDAKDLKAWLFENVQKAQTLNTALEKQQAQLDETVRTAVERAVTPMRDEIRRLRERVAELDLAASSASRFPRSGVEARPPLRASQSGGSPAEPFTRPSLPSRHPSSPAVIGTESPGPSSVAYDARRQPTSATRFEPRPAGDASRQLIPISALTHGPGSRESYRGSPVTSHFPHNRNDGHDRELAPLSRHSSSYNLQDAAQGRSRSRSPPRRREGITSPGRAAPSSRSPGP